MAVLLDRCIAFTRYILYVINGKNGIAIIQT
jgi:hypothetical protein